MTTSRPVPSVTRPPTQATTPGTTAATRPTPRTPATPPTPRTRATTAATTLSADAVRLTLDPVGLDEFLGEAFERRPLTIPRAEPGRFDGILSPADVERRVSATGIRVPAFRLVVDGAPLPLRDYTEDVP